MKLTTVVLIILAAVGSASAKKHEHNDADFAIAGTLMEQKQVNLGEDCASGGTIHTNPVNGVQGSESGSCDPIIKAQYTIVSDGVQYILQPIHHKRHEKNSVLSGQRPGTTFKMLIDNGTAYIKGPNGDRESAYAVVGSSLVPK